VVIPAVEFNWQTSALEALVAVGFKERITAPLAAGTEA
jgi:hypothetical protein